MKYISKTVTFLILLSIFTVSRADEGMWLINLLEKNLANKMKEAG